MKDLFHDSGKKKAKVRSSILTTSKVKTPAKSEPVEANGSSAAQSTTTQSAKAVPTTAANDVCFCYICC